MLGGGGATFQHGGCRYAQLYALNQYLAVAMGMPVLSINYRGGPGYGVAFRAANGSGWQGASEYQDVLAGATWLQGQHQRSHPPLPSTTREMSCALIFTCSPGTGRT